MSATIAVSVATCRRKRRYRTKKGAKKAILRTQAICGGAAMCAFRCPHCDGWHIGHRPAWSRGKAAEG